MDALGLELEIPGPLITLSEQWFTSTVDREYIFRQLCNKFAALGAGPD